MRLLHSLCVTAVLALHIVAQEPDEYARRAAKGAPIRDAAVANLKANKPFLALEWRRNAHGDLEYSAPADDGATFAPLFANGIADAGSCTGLVGRIVVPLHNGSISTRRVPNTRLQRCSANA